MSRNKILIVEDNQLVQYALEAMLSKLGRKADFAPNGKKALALYNTGYRLILMDIDLPDIDGVTVTKTIREIEKATHQHVPIVAMTSHSNEPDYQDSLKKQEWMAIQANRMQRN